MARPALICGMRALVAVAVVLFLGAVAVAASLWFHYHHSPDFDAYVRTRPAAAEALEKRWPAATELARKGDWRIGEIDPFALAEDDPTWRRHAVTFTASVKHGDELLATVVQEVAVAEDPRTGDRSGLAIRTRVTNRDPRMRVLARVWIDDERVTGPGSTRKGHAVFDVLVVAGPGPDELGVARLPEQDLVELEKLDPGETSGGFLRAWSHPGGDVDERGLIHHLRRSVYLAWEDRGGSSSSSQYQALETWRSTDEYSSTIECKLAEQGFSTTDKRSTDLSWNGRTW